MVLPSFSSWDKTAACLVFSIHVLHNSLLIKWLSLPPLATTFVIFHSLYFSVLFLCQPFQVRCLRLQNLKCCLHEENLPHPKPPNLPPLSPALAFTLRVAPNTGELCKVRGSYPQESSHHKEGNTHRQNASFGEKEIILKRKFECEE